MRNMDDMDVHDQYVDKVWSVDVVVGGDKALARSWREVCFDEMQHRHELCIHYRVWQCKVFVVVKSL